MVWRWCDAHAGKHTVIPEERRQNDRVTPEEINLLIYAFELVFAALLGKVEYIL